MNNMSGRVSHLEAGWVIMHSRPTPRQSNPWGNIRVGGSSSQQRSSGQANINVWWPLAGWTNTEGEKTKVLRVNVNDEVSKMQLKMLKLQIIFKIYYNANICNVMALTKMKLPGVTFCSVYIFLLWHLTQNDKKNRMVIFFPIQRPKYHYSRHNKSK